MGGEGNLGVALEEKLFFVKQKEEQVMKYEHPTLMADSKSSRTTGHLTPRASGDPIREGCLRGALGEKEFFVELWKVGPWSLTSHQLFSSARYFIAVVKIYG